MIFDCDSHLSPYRNHAKAIDAAGLNNLFEEAGVERALIWLMPQGVDDVRESNRYVHQSARRYPRFLPFGWTNVAEGLGKAKDEVKRCLLEYGFPGVKLNGAQNEYAIDCREAMLVCETIARYDGMIAFHIGADSPDFTSAYRAANVARAFPETTILMVHMGGAAEPDRAHEVIEVAKVHPKMMLIGSAIAAQRVKQAIDILGSERVLYGSDSPFHSLDTALADYASMLNEYSEIQRDMVMYENAARIFLGQPD